MNEEQLQQTANTLALQTLVDLAVALASGKDAEDGGVLISKDSAMEMLNNINGIMHLMGHALVIETTDNENEVNIYAKPLDSEVHDAE